MKQIHGIVDAKLIQSIRQSLKEKYGQDQHIQQIIEEIGTDEGLTRDELQVVYQAYLEVKERLYYTSLLNNLWNQIEDIQDRMALLHVYESLEQDLSQDAPIAPNKSNTSNTLHAPNMQNAPSTSNVIDPDDETDGIINMNRHIEMEPFTSVKNDADHIDLDDTSHNDIIDDLDDYYGSEGHVNNDVIDTSKHADLQNIKLKPIDTTNVEVPHIVMELLNQVYTKVKGDIDSGKISKKSLKQNAKSLKKEAKKLKSEFKKSKKDKKSKDKPKNKSKDKKANATSKDAKKKVESDQRQHTCLCGKGNSCKTDKCKKYHHKYM